MDQRVAHVRPRTREQEIVRLRERIDAIALRLIMGKGDSEGQAAWLQEIRQHELAIKNLEER